MVTTEPSGHHQPGHNAGTTKDSTWCFTGSPRPKSQILSLQQRHWALCFQCRGLNCTPPAWQTANSLLQKKKPLGLAQSGLPGKPVCAVSWRELPHPSSRANPYFMSNIFIAKHGSPKHNTENDLLKSPFQQQKVILPCFLYSWSFIEAKGKYYWPNWNRQIYTPSGNLICCANGKHYRYNPRAVNYNPINNASHLGSGFPVQEKMYIGKRLSEY